MHSFVLQDWTTIRGNSNVTLVTQPEHEWLDLEPYQDVVIWAQCSEVTGSPTIAFQTAPTKDDSLFQNMNSGSIVVTTAVTLISLIGASVPVARYVRWQLTQSGGVTWDASFRVMIAANAPGG